MLETISFMVIEYILFVIGIYLLVKSADAIVDGSSTLAKNLGVSTLIIGLTVVAFGTSLPELVVNIIAVLNGSSEIVFGNIIGSNMANILLVLGVSAIVGKVSIKIPTVWKQIPFALFAAFILFVLSGRIFLEGDVSYLNKTDGLILLSFFGVFLYYIFQKMREDKSRLEIEDHFEHSNKEIVLKLFFGLIGIYFGGRWVVDGAIFIASQLGVGEFLISATIIALGTSLPELAVGINAVRKGKTDLAVGNVIGSNIFNILLVMGIVPLINSVAIPSFVLFDIALMFFATLLLFIFMFIGPKRELWKKEGIVFVLLYVFYIIYLIGRI